ncbi:MAG TPA: class I SAM-dependent methyltransferase, partial [Pseudoneobacillus sp.]|nr:class I SAM-dependent methyltransferase [Pseudoneobacillus sp.]
MNSRMKWNNKYLDRISQSEEPSPNPRLQAVSAYLNGGNALDLACGLGANSLFLAGMNYQVQALDISDVAINYLLEKVAKYDLDIHPQVCDLTDLSNLEWDNSRYDLVVITYYLD